MIYTHGLDIYGDWESASAGTFIHLALVDSLYTFDRSHQFIDDLVPGTTEATVAGYARPDVDTPVRTVDLADDRIVYTCASPNFGPMAAGETVTHLITARWVTDDSDSLLIACHEVNLGNGIETDGDDLIVAVRSSGLFRLAEAV